MEERGVEVDHATLNRWVIRYSPDIAVNAKSQKRETNKSWRMDETYIKVKGQWTYLYRAVDSHGDTLDFMLSERRDEEAATAFFKQTINNNGFPDKVVMDKSGANYAGLANINLLLILAGFATMIDILQVKYLNNIIEQDHRFIKKITKPMMGFKAFHSAQATIDGIETAHMIRIPRIKISLKSPLYLILSLFISEACAIQITYDIPYTFDGRESLDLGSGLNLLLCMNISSKFDFIN